MKLIDLLVQELPKRGGWPDGAVECQRFVDESTIDFYDATGNWPQDCGKVYGPIAHQLVRKQHHPCELETVTRDQYESALAAAQQPVWNGEGLPPVGCECEAKYRDAANAEWFPFRCVGVDFGFAFGWAGKDAVTLGKGSYEFRPISSEANKKREKAIELMLNVFFSAPPVVDTPNEVDRIAMGELYDAIAAGNIPGVKLEVTP